MKSFVLVVAMSVIAPGIAPCQSTQPRNGDRVVTIDETGKVGVEGSGGREEAERSEVESVLREMETTLQQIGTARDQVVNVRKVLEALDLGKVQATEKEQVKTNQFVRKELAKGFRELRARARGVVNQVDTVLVPKQRGMAEKLKARAELEQDPDLRSRIGKLVGEHQQAMEETRAQTERLKSNVEALSQALRIVEGQLSYLDLVEESLELSKNVSQQLRDLNTEIDAVVNALLEKEIGG